MRGEGAVVDVVACLGALAEGGELMRLDAGAFQVAPVARAETIGVQVAQSVYGSMTK